MPDIRNIRSGSVTPDRIFRVIDNQAREIRRIYKVINNQPVIVWDVNRVLTTDFTLKGVTTFIYEEGITSKNVSYLHPRKINGIGEDGIISFTIEDVTISFPIDKPMYGNSSLYDLFCYRDGLWGIETAIAVHTYTGSEIWEKIGNSTFAIDNPDGLYKPMSNSNYIWSVSNITGTYSSYKAAYKEDNCIGVGLTKTALSLTSDVPDLETFYTVMANLTKSGNPVKMLRRLETPVWEPLPESVQEYLRSFMP